MPKLQVILAIVLVLGACLVLPARGSEESATWMWTCEIEPGWTAPKVEGRFIHSDHQLEDLAEAGEPSRAFPIQAWAFNITGDIPVDENDRKRVNEATVSWFTPYGEIAHVLRLPGHSEAWVSEDGTTALHARLIAGDYNMRAGDRPMTHVTCQRRDGAILWQQTLPHARYALSPTGDTIVRLAVDAAEVYTAQGALLARIPGMFMRDDVFFNQSETRVLLLSGGWNTALWEQASTIAVCLDSHGAVRWQRDLGPTSSATASWLSSGESACIAYATSPTDNEEASPPAVVVIIDDEGRDVARRVIDGEPAYVSTSPDGSRVLVALGGRERSEPNRLMSLESPTLTLEHTMEIPSDYGVSGVAAGRGARVAVAIGCNSELKGEILFFDGSSFVGRIEAAAALVDWIDVSDDLESVLFGRRWARGDGIGFVQVASWQ